MRKPPSGGFLLPALTHLNRGIANAKAERHNLAAHPDMGGRKSINLQRCGMQKIWALGLVSVLAGAVLVACGGGGGGGGAPATSTITGSVVKGPVNGATVRFKKADGSTLGQATTGTDGSYTFTTDYQGDITIEATGGSYVDETTKAATPLSATLTTVVKTSGNQVIGVVTPFTTMAVKYSTQGGKLPTAAQLQQGAQTLATQLGASGVDLLKQKPGFGEGVNQYGRMLQAFSQYTATAGTLDLNKLFKASLTPQEIADFNTQFANAYKTANGQTITVTLDPNGFTISGTGVGGGSGKCGVSYAYVVNGAAAGTLDYCVSGLPESCAMSAQDKASMDASVQVAKDEIKKNLPAGMSVDFQLSVTPSCKAGAIDLKLAP
jgi:hypothetical protein